jgi:hypothetical protein
VQGIMQKLQPLTNQIQALATAVASSGFAPAYPLERIQGMERQIAEMREAAEGTAEAHVAALAEADSLREIITGLESRLEQAVTDRDAAVALAHEAENSGAWKQALAAVVAQVEQHLSTNDFIQLAGGVASVRALMEATKKNLAENQPPKGPTP